METITISITYSLKWQIKGYEKYKVTLCGKIINCQKGKIIKKVLNGSSPGYWLGKKFYSLNQLRTMLEPIKYNDCPF